MMKMQSVETARLLTDRDRQRAAEGVVGDLSLLLQQWVALSRTEAEVHHRELQGACNRHRALLKYGLLYPWSFSCECGGRRFVDQRCH